MPLNIWLKPNSPQITGGVDRTAIFQYGVEGTTDYEAARIAILAYTAVFANVDGHYLTRQTPDLQIVDGHEDLWDATLRYGRPSLSQNQVEFEFRLGGTTDTIYQAREKISTHTVPDYDAVDIGLSLGITTNGIKREVHGIPIYIPTMAFNIKFRPPIEWFTRVRRLMIAQATYAPVNDQPFFGFQPGEVLFKGADGGCRTGEVIGQFDLNQTELHLGSPYGEMNFEFEVSPNRWITIGDIPRFFKRGWDRVEIWYDESDPTADPNLPGMIIPVANAAYVMRVYDYSDLRLIGCGG